MPSLLIFAEVARRSSFTEAADHLGMSKSAVSQNLTKLEEQLGLQLMVRNTRGLTLTNSGKKLLQRSEHLKDQVDLAFEEMKSDEESPSGRFSVTAPHILQRTILMPAVAQLCREFPKIEPHIVISDKPLDLMNDKLDVALFGGDLPDSNYRMLPIGSVVEKIYTTPAYFEKMGRPTHIDGIRDYAWIAADWQKKSRSFLDDDQPIHPNFKEHPDMTSNSLTCVVDLVKNNMGYAFLPAFAFENFNTECNDQEELMHILQSITRKRWPFYFLHSYQHKKPIHVARFYTLVKHFFSAALYKE